MRERTRDCNYPRDFKNVRVVLASRFVFHPANRECFFNNPNRTVGALSPPSHAVAMPAPRASTRARATKRPSSSESAPSASRAPRPRPAPADPFQNARAGDDDSRRFCGVVARPTGGYRAFVWSDGKSYALGAFDRAEDAAMMHDRARIVFGKEAKNFDASRFDASECARWSSDSYTLTDLRREYGTKREGRTHSEYRGVTKDVRTGKYRAEIYSGGGSLSVGTYATEIEAAEAYDRAAITLRGEAATTNFSAKKYANDPAMRGMEGNLDKFRDSLASLKTRKNGGKSTSKHEGVRRYEHRWKNGNVTVKWRAEVTVNGKKKQLGYFEKEAEAAKAVEKFNRDAAAV